jgi:cell division protease FtsH
MASEEKKDNKTQNNGGGNIPKNPFKGNSGGNKGKFNFYWIYAILAAIFIMFQFFSWDNNVKTADWQEIKQMLSTGEISKIVLVNKENAEIFLKADENNNNESFMADARKPAYTYTIGSVETFEKDVSEAQKNIPEADRIYVKHENRRNWGGEIISYILPILILVGVWFFIMRMMSRGGPGGGQIFNIGKSKAQLFDKDTKVSINFNDVAGLEEAKIEVMEIVDFLKNPKKYTDLGGKIPKGALLVGPPGTGKTLLAKAVAGEAQVPFFSLSGSDFVEMFVGVGASRVRDLFKQAKEKAPCIVFIDEIDAIGRARGKNPMTGANDERENTLNQLLTEMDGFSMNTGVIILAATNRADILDRALLRAGRFDRQIHVELPDLDERRAIFDVHIKPLRIDKETVNVDFLAKQTPGFSGADIANVCNESALIGARRNKKKIDKQDFMDAIDRIIGGLEKKNKIITSHEKKVIAYHEAGHAAVSWLLEYAHPLVKVTIIPRGKSLGAAWYLPEERQITTKDQMLDEMTAALGGRASEQVHFGEISTGALNDLEKVTKQAYNMVVYFGLNDKIGNISYYDSSGQQEYSFHKPYSENTAELIDEEISKLIEGAYARAIKIIDENKEKVSLLAERLLEHEVIFREDVEEIFGKRNFEREERDREEKEQILKLREEHRKKMMEESEKLAKAEAEKNDEKPEEKNGAPQDAQDETVEETKNS